MPSRPIAYLSVYHAFAPEVLDHTSAFGFAPHLLIGFAGIVHFVTLRQTACNPQAFDVRYKEARSSPSTSLFGASSAWRLSGTAAGIADIHFAAFGLAASDQILPFTLLARTSGFDESCRLSATMLTNSRAADMVVQSITPAPETGRFRNARPSCFSISDAPFRENAFWKRFPKNPCMPPRCLHEPAPAIPQHVSFQEETQALKRHRKDHVRHAAGIGCSRGPGSDSASTAQ